MKLIIDTDPGVDDAFALLFALAHPQLEVVGVTTVGGNVGLDAVTRNASGLIALSARHYDFNIPQLFKGLQAEGRERAEAVHGAGGLGGVVLDAETPVKEGAVEYIVRTLRSTPGQIHLVALGPMTNIAAALELEPDLPKLAAGLSIMGGAERGGNVGNAAEFNIWQDPEAAEKVFMAKWRSLAMCGLDATNQATFTPDLRELCFQAGRDGNQVGALLHDITRDYINRDWQANRVLGCRIHDLLPVALLVNPRITEYVAAKVRVQVGGPYDGRTVVTRSTGTVKVYTDTTNNSMLMGLFMNTLFPNFKARYKVDVTSRLS